ncbi:hypothetical protein F8M41_024416 [Gigaspora margarita]|uniref:Uncharacterized protein n=1 Tax=Gigaspora margarita TaxID=4874 RepID=A0A8H3XKB1_GIGMA|nr:hypothetical protein F8M41_024416 [Gigaspora margarita]
MIEVWRNCHSKINQEFAIAVIEMMFDPAITTTSLTSDDIDAFMQARTIKIMQMKNENEPVDQLLEDCFNYYLDTYYNAFNSDDDNYSGSPSPINSSEHQYASNYPIAVSPKR